MNPGVSTMTMQQLQAVLTQVGATLLKKTGVSQVWISKRINKTFTIFATQQPGVVRVQVTGGCAC
jgi:hypothetical protein